MSDLDHTALMRAALDQARLAVGLTEPNPRVGCVLTAADGRVIGLGHTQQAGGPHAEVMALRDAQQRGESVRGATVLCHARTLRAPRSNATLLRRVDRRRCGPRGDGGAGPLSAGRRPGRRALARSGHRGDRRPAGTTRPARAQHRLLLAHASAAGPGCASRWRCRWMAAPPCPTAPASGSPAAPRVPTAMPSANVRAPSSPAWVPCARTTRDST